jgi:uncharacterized protein
MRRWIGIAASAVLVLGASGRAVAAPPPSEAQVRQLFEVLHLDQRMMQMGSQFTGLMGRAVPCVPASYWQGFIDADATQELLGRMVPIYQSHFTAEDVAGLLKFYQSPLGQKVITQMPLTMAEGMKIGQQWGRERGQAMIEQLRQNGTLDAQGRCPASPAASTPKPASKLGY